MFYVTQREAVYHEDVESREEGGTPGIVESIRAGLVVQLKEAAGADFIMRREGELTERIVARLAGIEVCHEKYLYLGCNMTFSRTFI